MFYRREEKMLVVDYCQRNLLDLTAVELSAALPGLAGTEGDRGAWLSLIQNCEKKTQEMIVIFQQQADRQTWIDLVKPKQVKPNLTAPFQCPSSLLPSLISLFTEVSSGAGREDLRQLGLSSGGGQPGLPGGGQPGAGGGGQCSQEKR